MFKITSPLIYSTLDPLLPVYFSSAPIHEIRLSFSLSISISKPPQSFHTPPSLSQIPQPKHRIPPHRHTIPNPTPPPPKFKVYNRLLNIGPITSSHPFTTPPLSLACTFNGNILVHAINRS